MRSSDIVATAQDIFAYVFYPDTWRRIRAVARRNVPVNEVDDYCQAVLGALWELILSDVERLDPQNAVEFHCKRLKWCWQRNWAKVACEEHSDYRPEWLDPFEVLMVDAYLAEVEYNENGGAMNRKQWWTARTLASIVGVSRAEVEPLQIAIVNRVASRCEAILLYSTICEALADLLAEWSE